MTGGVILFILEGTSDETAIVTFVSDYLKKNKIRTTVKCMHGDILTEMLDKTKEFIVEPSKVKAAVQNQIIEFLNSSSINSQHIKSKDVSRVYYITDIDDCFKKVADYSLNKRQSLIKLFAYDEINVNKTRNTKTERLVPFKVLFFSKNLEEIIANDFRDDISDDEKKRISTKFAEDCIKDKQNFFKTFTGDDINTWNTYKESYTGIRNTEGRACNINNLIDEMNEWKKK